MKPLGDSNHHFWLAQRMAKTTGADLVAAFQQGELVQAEWAQIVQNCRGCDWTDGCERWLEKHESATCIPNSCVNCGRFAELQSLDETKGSERT